MPSFEEHLQKCDIAESTQLILQREDSSEHADWIVIRRRKLTVCATLRHGCVYHDLLDCDPKTQTIVDFRINETLQIGGLGKRNYRSPVW